ncbi:hypothetical protein TBLA_0F03000 [Henningerozyma blattae CBS 6284]|uniref:PH domain-containing protein n=1 Tax=Henningerozyma blattae (strain ATCC 34711 / CBS 6284 / DSM 70876 / NBRC 10599 / NRRL Y-10934 / UCD 77-7) TaxID=1071380 RepID=I2H637_HENB6|nr:hypothetical protein TBLA_0F03000 [Tetrapisispora blattae CBS 6284]CCH61839.1 hypothetical protein TBLA_0F03000 [Tetrapisispora blattae CBS 6284]
MNNIIDDALRATTDDLEYIRRTTAYSSRNMNFSFKSNDTDKNNSPENKNDTEDIDIIKIPKLSYTAYKLLYASPVEISSCSKIVLLGGIPIQWYIEQKAGFWHIISFLAFRNQRRTIKKQTTLRYRAVYHRKQKKFHYSTAAVNAFKSTSPQSINKATDNSNSDNNSTARQDHVKHKKKLKIKQKYKHIKSKKVSSPTYFKTSSNKHNSNKRKLKSHLVSFSTDTPAPIISDYTTPITPNTSTETDNGSDNIRQDTNTISNILENNGFRDPLWKDTVIIPTESTKTIYSSVKNQLLARNTVATQTPAQMNEPKIIYEKSKSFITNDQNLDKEDKEGIALSAYKFHKRAYTITSSSPQNYSTLIKGTAEAPNTITSKTGNRHIYRHNSKDSIHSLNQNDISTHQNSKYFTAKQTLNSHQNKNNNIPFNDKNLISLLTPTTDETNPTSGSAQDFFTASDFKGRKTPTIIINNPSSSSNTTNDDDQRNSTIATTFNINGKTVPTVPLTPSLLEKFPPTTIVTETNSSSSSASQSTSISQYYSMDDESRLNSNESRPSKDSIRTTQSFNGQGTSMSRDYLHPIDSMSSNTIDKKTIKVYPKTSSDYNLERLKPVNSQSPTFSIQSTISNSQDDIPLATQKSSKLNHFKSKSGELFKHIVKLENSSGSILKKPKLRSKQKLDLSPVSTISSNVTSNHKSNLTKLTAVPPKPIDLPRDEIIHLLNPPVYKQPYIRSHISDAKSSAKKTVKSTLSDFAHTEYEIYRHIRRKLKYGKVIMMERMLVMVKEAIIQKEISPEFNECENIDTRVFDRWKEYIVVARATGNAVKPILIQFYHNRKIPEISTEIRDATTIRGNSLDFYLSRECFIGFYSTLDKTICIQKPDDKLFRLNEGIEYIDYKDIDPLKIFILRSKTFYSSHKWHDFLKSSLGINTLPKNVTIKIPELSASINISLTTTLLNYLQYKETEENQYLKIAILDRGYKVFQYPLLRFLNILIFDKFREARFHEILKKWEAPNNIMGCDIKHYDRIEWVPSHESDLLGCAYSTIKSHILEYRSLIQYSRETFNGSEILVEPSATEGFLIRFTDKYGADRTKFGKLFIRPSYFFTSDNLLFYMSSLKAIPPLPKEAAVDDMMNPYEMDKIKHIMDSLPNIYEQNPYEVNLSSQINWLNKNITSEELNERDMYGFKCFNRRILQILKAESIIDLALVKDVYQGTSRDLQHNELKYHVLVTATLAFWQKRVTVQDIAESTIFIKTGNNLLLKLLAPSADIAREWVCRLQKLVRYWRIKQSNLVKRMQDIKQKNLLHLRMTHNEEANIGMTTSKWVADRGIADASIYHINGLSLLRPIILKGFLYQKPSKHSVFKKYFTILVPGFLLLYSCYHRSPAGYAKPVLNYKFHSSLSLDESYLYSGRTSEPDLLKRDKMFDGINPGSHSLPRVYNDGWRSCEDETSRCFTLWFGTKRAISKYSKDIEENTDYYSDINIDESPSTSSSSTLENVENTRLVRTVNRLGVGGKTMVFMARSRQERDLWVLSIYYELETVRKANLQQS